MTNTLYYGDCLDVLRELAEEHPQGIADLIYLDPPFNSRKAISKQKHKSNCVRKKDWIFRVVGIIVFLLTLSVGVKLPAQLLNGEKPASSVGLQRVRVIEHTYCNRERLSSPLWPSDPHSGNMEEYDRKFMGLMHSMNADSSAHRTIQLTDSLSPNETLCKYSASTSVMEIHSTDSLVIVKTAGYDVSKLLIHRYFTSISEDSQSSSDTCTITVRPPWESPTISPTDPAVSDTDRELMSRQIPFLIMEAFATREMDRIRDSIPIPLAIAQLFAKYYILAPVISEAWLFAPSVDTNDEVVFPCRISASGINGLSRVELPLNGEIVFNKNSGTISNLWFEAETVLSAIGKKIPIEGVGHVSVSFTNK